MESSTEHAGELAIDLANTLQLQRDGTTVDLLADQDGLARWLRGAGGPDVGGPRRDRLRQCGAPGCGRWFLASRPRQRWCSPACGNRARLARSTSVTGPHSDLAGRGSVALPASLA
jgi:predicted RNA-binding Zn ribbon-like protein